MSFSVSNLTFTRIFDSSILPGIPTSVSIASGDAQLTISFNAPSFNGGSAITGYEFSTDGGTSFKSAGTTISPFIVTTVSSNSNPLVNGVTYNIQIRARNVNGAGTATASIAATPGTVSLTNIALLRSSSTPYQTEGTDVNVQGYYAASDDGGGTFRFNSSSLFSDNSATIIRPNNIAAASPGRWVRQFQNGYACAEMWGARGDGLSDDSRFIHAAVDYVSLSGASLGYTLNLNSKTYFLSTYDVKGNTQFMQSGDFFLAPFICIGYYPGRNYKHQFNLIGTANTVLCASNLASRSQVQWAAGRRTIKWENGQETVNGARMFISLRSSVTACRIKNITFFNDGFNTLQLGANYLTPTGAVSSNPNGLQFYTSSTGGIEETSNTGGSTWGTAEDTLYREYIAVNDCKFINISFRPINAGSCVATGSGTQTWYVTGCQFLNPKGSDSSDTGGGSQATYWNSGTRRLYFTENFSEGSTFTDVRCPNGLAVDGNIIAMPLETYVERCTFARHSVETLYLNCGQPFGIYMGDPGYPVAFQSSWVIMPAVGQTTNFRCWFPLNNGYNSVRQITSFGLGPGDIGSIPESNYTAGKTGGTYIINSLSALGDNYWNINVTRVSGANYGGELAVTKDFAPGSCLSGTHMYIFNFHKKYNQFAYVKDNVWTRGDVNSASRLPQYANTREVLPAHNPAIRMDSWNAYMSGNKFTAGLGFLNFSTRPDATVIIDKNDFYMYNYDPIIPKPSFYTPTSAISSIRDDAEHWVLMRIGMSGAQIINNRFWFWTDSNNLTTTRIGSAFPQKYYNCNDQFIPNNPALGFRPVRFIGVELNYGPSISIPQTVQNNTIYVTNPLSAHLINFTLVTPSFAADKTISNNTFINI